MVWFVLLGFCLVVFLFVVVVGVLWGGGLVVVGFILVWFFGQKRIRESDFLHLTDTSLYFLFIPSG